MERCTAFVLLLAIACVPVLVGADDELPDPPEPRADAHGRYLSPYAQNDTLAPWVAEVMARKLDINFDALAARSSPGGGRGIASAGELALALSSERPAGLEQEYAALTRGLAGGGERAGDLRTGVRLARLIGEGDPDRIISRLGQEVTKTVASEAFSRVAGEIGGFGSLLGPIAALAAGAMDGGARARPQVDIDRLRHLADRSFDQLDAMLVHTVVYYRTRDDFEYAIEAVLRAYPGAHEQINDAMRTAGEIVYAEVRRMGGAGSMDIEWTSGDE